VDVYGRVAASPCNPCYLLLLPLLLRHGRGAEYCDQLVCLSICPQTYLWNCWTDLHDLFVHIPCGRGSGLLWRHSDTLCSSGFMDDVTFGRSGPDSDTWRLAAAATTAGLSGTGVQSDVCDYECFVVNVDMKLCVQVVSTIRRFAMLHCADRCTGLLLGRERLDGLLCMRHTPLYRRPQCYMDRQQRGTPHRQPALRPAH